MNKFLVPAIAVVVVIVGIIAFMLLNPGSSAPDSATETSEMTQLPTENRSIKDLIGFVGNQECSFSDGSGNAGTVYGSGGKVRGDFMSTVGTEEQAGHMLYDGTTMHMWFDGSSEGFKISMAEMEKLQGDTTRANFDINQKVDYECHDWSVDQSKFVLPTDVKFTDFGAMMTLPTGVMDSDSAEGESSEDMKATQCAACDSLPEAAAAQCRKALSC